MSMISHFRVAQNKDFRVIAICFNWGLVGQVMTIIQLMYIPLVNLGNCVFVSNNSK